MDRLNAGELRDLLQAIQTTHFHCRCCIDQTDRGDDLLQRLMLLSGKLQKELELLK